ncbi:MAG: porin family protein [Flavobacteriaceae bacterium]
MKKHLLLAFSFLLPLLSFSQEEEKAPLSTVIDSLYREDQMYIGFTYNILGNQPKDLSQSGFSSGLHLGFIRDMPINKNRNVALGLGLGFSGNSFSHNLLIENDNYALLKEGEGYSKNKLSRYLIEVPFEFRWRTSTPTSYNFWRIYTGFKVGYLFHNTVKYSGDQGSYKITNFKGFNDLQYGITLNAGYSTWNLSLYYGLNPIFSSSETLNGNVMDLNTIKVGLMFYVL